MIVGRASREPTFRPVVRTLQNRMLLLLLPMRGVARKRMGAGEGGGRGANDPRVFVLSKIVVVVFYIKSLP